MAYFQCMNIGSEGASVLEDLTDISLNNLTNGQILKYNTTTQKWENSNESGEIPDVQLFETLTYTEVKISSVVSPFTITNNTLTSVSSSMSNSETNILSTGTFDLTDINIIEVVVDSATFYQGGNWNGFFYVCDDDTDVRNNTYPSVAHKIMFSNTSTPLKYSLDVSQLNGQWFIGVCTGGHTNLVVSAVAIGSGLTGHVIIDKNNVDMSQRSGLQFTGNVTVTDDSTNDKTVVNIQGTSIDDTTASGSTTYSSNKTDTLLSGKVDKVNGKGLSTNDYTDADKTKLAGIATGAEVNVQSDWNQTDPTQDDYIKNKPSAEEQTATDEFTTINGGLLSECKVALSPNQDLHGYDSPWVGGASKNKMPLTVENLKAWNTSGTWSGNKYSYGGMDFSILTDDDNNVIGIDENGTTSSYPTFKIFSGTLNGSYRLCRNNARSRVYVNGSQVDDGTSDYSFTASGETYEINLFTGAVTLDHQIVKPMLVLSTETDFNFAPYSNICPISGHTEVEVQNHQKNLCDNSANIIGLWESDGTYHDNLSYRTSDLIEVSANTEYSVSLFDLSTNTRVNGLVVTEWDANSEIIGQVDGNTLTTTANTKYVRIRNYGANSALVQTSNYAYQLELGSTATAYEPYNGYQVTVNLGGTYYSGTLDVVTGVFVLDTVGKDMTTITDWNIDTSDQRIYKVLSDIKTTSSGSEIPNLISNRFKAISVNDIYSYVQGVAVSTGSALQFHINGLTDRNDVTLAEVNQWFVDNPTLVVYELATPTPIQLSPTMVKALVGENHFSAPLEGQEITESKYRELFTWDEVEALSQRIATSAVADLRCYQSQDGAYGMLAYVDSGTVFYDWVAASPSVKLLSTISVMPPLDEIEFTDSSIYSSSICELIVVGDSDVPVVTHVKVTSGKVVFTLSEALDSTIRCACKVTNSILY